MRSLAEQGGLGVRPIASSKPDARERQLMAETGSPGATPLSEIGRPYLFTKCQLTVLPGKTRSRPRTDDGDRLFPVPEVIVYVGLLHG